MKDQNQGFTSVSAGSDQFRRLTRGDDDGRITGALNEPSFRRLDAHLARNGVPGLDAGVTMYLTGTRHFFH